MIRGTRMMKISDVLVACALTTMALYAIPGVRGDCYRPTFMDPYAIVLDPHQEIYGTYFPIDLTCETGHTSSGLPDRAYCVPDGTWEPSPSGGVCYAQCSSSEFDDDLVVTSSTFDQAAEEIFDHGDVVFISCSSPGQFVGDSTSVCDNGTFQGTQQCLDYCLEPSVEGGAQYEVSTPALIINGSVYFETGTVVHYYTADDDEGANYNCSGLQLCDDGSWTNYELEACSVPTVYGGGTPTLYPDSHCYVNSTSVVIGCSGVLFGASLSTCEGPDTWDLKSPPTCEERTCLPPSPPTNGRVDSAEPQGDFELYDTVTISCDAGFSLLGPSTLMCEGTGEWAPPPPVCLENCLIPEIDAGYIDFPTNSSLLDGEQAEVTCETGFTLIGVETVTCHDGVWDPPIGLCQTLYCPEPNVEEGVQYEASTPALNISGSVHFEPGTVVHYYTSDDDEGASYNCSGSQLCDDGLWMNYDLEVCSAPTVYGGGTPTLYPDSHCYINSTSVVIGCSGVLFGASLSTCEGPDTWDLKSLPTCEERTCLPPSPPTNGRVDSAEPQGDYELYDTVTISCDAGFSLLGPSTLMCEGSGEWAPPPPVCLENCLIPEVDAGYTDFPTNSSLLDGEQAEVTCEPSFTLIGVETVTCHDGVWDPPIGLCQRECPEPEITHSNYVGGNGSVDHGEYLIVECDDDYTAGLGTNYSNPLTCNDGQWDASVVCYGNCERPNFPPSLQITPDARVGDSYYHADVITVTCAPNYDAQPQGPLSSDMVCDSGLWTANILPYCKHVNDT